MTMFSKKQSGMKRGTKPPARRTLFVHYGTFSRTLDLWNIKYLIFQRVMMSLKERERFEIHRFVFTLSTWMYFSILSV